MSTNRIVDNRWEVVHTRGVSELRTLGMPSCSPPSLYQPRKILLIDMALQTQHHCIQMKLQSEVERSKHADCPSIPSVRYDGWRLRTDQPSLVEHGCFDTIVWCPRHVKVDLIIVYCRLMHYLFYLFHLLHLLCLHLLLLLDHHWPL